jgi:hypothetical protein
MSVDPADDCTFWYTNEYIPTNGNWRTRIARFTFDTCLQTDLLPPRCEFTALNPGPPRSIEITTQDARSGLGQINVLVEENVTVNVPPFTPGTRNPVIVTVTKTNQSQSARVALEVRDVAGNTITCDPVFARLTIPEDRRWVQQTFTDIPQAERFVSLQNGNPGLTALLVLVNGQRFVISALEDEEEQTLDVSEAMVEGDNNTITLVGIGAPGSSGLVIISDGTALDIEGRYPYVLQRDGPQASRQTITWGNR